MVDKITILLIILSFVLVGCCNVCEPTDTNSNGNKDNRIYFTAFSLNLNNPVIFSCYEDGKDIKELINNGIIYSSPSDNGKICFTKYDSISGTKWLYLSNIDGSEEKLLAKENDLFSYGNPALSPDGKFICFNAGNKNLIVLDIAKTVFNQISFKLSNNTKPAFSPDGKKLAFFEDAADNKSFKLKVISAENTDVITELYSVQLNGKLQSQNNENSISWSSNSINLAFSYQSDVNDLIKIIDVNNGSQTEFAFVSNAIGVVNPAVNNQFNVVCFSGRDGNIWIRNLNIDDKRLFQITKAESDENYSNPQWSSDGKNILCNVSNNSEINMSYSNLITLSIKKEDEISSMTKSSMISNNVMNGFWNK